MSNYFDKEILKNLTKIPTPTTPGSLIVTGSSQAVFTGPNSGDVVIAAAKYGNGRIIVTSHDVYLNWLHEKSHGTKKSFMTNVKEWLCGFNVDDSLITNLNSDNNQDFSNYKLIKWHQEVEISPEKQQNLLSFIESGGSLFCGSTPWGYLQIHPDRTLNDMCLHNFLKNFFGIIFTPNYLHFPEEETNVSVNQSKRAHFDVAVDKISINPDKIEKYMNTIQSGLEILNKEGVVSDRKICDIKECVLNHCKQKSLNIIPNEKNPICDVNGMNAVKLISKCLLATSEEQAPGIELFPGTFSGQPSLQKEVEFNFKTRFNERLSTGYYLPAGLNLIIDVKETSNSNWHILIGCHSDDLSNCDELKRWPCLTTQKSLAQGLNILISPFGGLVYIISPENGGEISLVLSNIVESPLLDITRPNTVTDWNRRRQSEGLWAEVAGKHIIFSTPSNCVKNLNAENLVEVLNFWDQVVSSHHHLRGTNVNDYRRERVVNDMQPSAGYMHSGYPIVTHLDCCQDSCDQCIFDVKKLESKGNWGLFHELGHNMQRDEWTFDGSVEVTVNLFSMHVFHCLLGKHVTKQQWLRDQYNNFSKYFSKEPNYNDWQNDFGIALATFAQLIKHFGWDPMYKFMRDYECDIQQGTNLPQNNQDKIDNWVLRYSKIISRNIKPQFQMFGLPVSDKYDNELRGLEPWCLESEKNAEKFFN